MREIFWRHLVWKAVSKHLSEGELESTWTCSIQKYCRVQQNREFVPVQWEIGSHWPWSEIEAVSAVPHDNTELGQYHSQPGAVGESRTSGWRGKTPCGKPVSTINTVRKSQAASQLRPMEIPPLYHIWRTSPAYSCSSMSSWPLSRLYHVLCLDAISRLGKWAPCGIITLLLFGGVEISRKKSAIWVECDKPHNSVKNERNWLKFGVYVVDIAMYTQVKFQLDGLKLT